MSFSYSCAWKVPLNCSLFFPSISINRPTEMRQQRRKNTEAFRSFHPCANWAAKSFPKTFAAQTRSPRTEEVVETPPSPHLHLQAVKPLCKSGLGAQACKEFSVQSLLLPPATACPQESDLIAEPFKTAQGRQEKIME